MIQPGPSGFDRNLLESPLMSIHRIATCSWSLQPEDPESLVDRLKKTGLKAVQLALTPLVTDPTRWSDTFSRLEAAGIEVLSGMMEPLEEDYSTLESIARSGGVRPDATWEGNLRMASAIAECAAANGIELVTLHAGFIPKDADDPERGIMLDRLGLIIDVFAKHRVQVAFETGQETATTLLELLDLLDRSSHLGVNFDPANMILYGKGDPIDALQALAPHVLQVHIKDALPAGAPGSWGSEMPAGEGAVDWPAFLSIVEGLERPIDLVIEREGGDRRIEDIRKAIAMLGDES
tara:strand:- start:73 stop:951 length:879 start_codon:yes stop_codon:yes gene_type:complete